jgi:hypothetical protein
MFDILLSLFILFVIEAVLTGFAWRKYRKGYVLLPIILVNFIDIVTLTFLHRTCLVPNFICGIGAYSNFALVHHIVALCVLTWMIVRSRRSKI